MKFIKTIKAFFILSILLVCFYADSIAFRVSKIILITELGQFEFYVEVAETPEQLGYGLSGKDSIRADSGMLFLFPQSMTASMWMKNIPFNIDMLFINRQGTITEVYESVIANSQSVIQSQTAVRAVLELSETTINNIGLKPGDKIINEFFN